MDATNLKHLNLSKSLYIFYKIKFTTYANYYLKLSWSNIYFFSVKIHVFRVKNFDVLKIKFLKNK